MIPHYHRELATLKCFHKRNQNKSMQYIPWNMHILLLWFICWCYITRAYWIHGMCLPISFRVTSPVLGQSNDCPSASEVTLTDWGKIGCGPFYQHSLILIPAWISNYIHYKVWDVIAYPFLNFNGCTVEVQEWISNFIPHFTKHVITYPFWDWS